MKTKKDDNLDSLLKASGLEIVAALLLLSGQLTVGRVVVGREGDVELRVVGEFKKSENPQVNELYNFLKSNGNMSIDTVVEAFKKKLND